MPAVLRATDLLRELRFAARTLRRTPGFTLVAIVSLALGLALAASTIAVVNAYLIRSMPYPASDRLYRVRYAPIGEREPGTMSALDWSTLADIVEVADTSTSARFYLVGDGYTRDAMGLMAAPGSLDALGVRATIGRSLLAEDYRANADAVVLIGPALWRDRFGSDPAIVGRTFRASLSSLADPAQTFRIVGVLPPDFRWAREYARGDVEIVMPLRRPMTAYMVRLRPGVPVADAERRLTIAATAAATSMPANWRGIHLDSIREEYSRELKPMLFAITAAVGLVLVIVCANVAVLVLLRALRRQQEVAVRVALGAGRRHIVSMLVGEACILCGSALVAGLTLTRLTLGLLAPIVEARLGRDAPGGSSAIAIDGTVLLIVAGAGLVIALMLSVIPALAPWQRRLAEALRRDGRTGTDRPSMRHLRSALIACEVAASLALLVGCGLMIRSVVHLVRTDLGYQVTHVVRSRIALPARTYPDAASFLAFFDRLTERLSDVSARTHAQFAFTNFIPLYDTPRQRVEIDDEPGRDERTGGAGATAGLLAVSDGYFSLFDIGMRQGRGFTARDRAGAEPVAVISETLARRLWPDGRAIGRRLRTADQPIPSSALTEWRTVVGIARDVRQTHTDADLNDIYIPFLQAPTRYAPLYVRADRPPSFWLDTLRATVADIDREVLVTGGTALEVEADQLLAGPRFLMSVLTTFAVFATGLAILGIYGVTAYAVRQRQREIAIRMALGATGRAIGRLFLRDGAVVIVCGLAGGLLGAAAIARMLMHQLHGVQPFDAATLAATCVLMAFAALAATWWPARRASARNPAASLLDA